MFTEDNNASFSGVRKPMLDTSEMIEDLKRKGIKFEHMSEEEARAFLEQNTNYFKLRAYRKNFEIVTSGPKKGQYLDLDFAALRDLSTIDMQLRYVLIHMCLDIEHCIKVDMIRKVQKNNKNDAYNIVNNYIKEYQAWKYSDPNGTDFKEALFAIQRGDIYRKDLVEKYQDDCPIWVIAEIMHFGDLLRFYAFTQCRYVCQGCPIPNQKLPSPTCKRILDGNLSSFKAYMLANDLSHPSIELCPRIHEIEKMDRLLQDVRRIRNASAHNSCFLNDLRIPKGNGNDDTASPLLVNGLRQILPQLQERIPDIKEKNINILLKNPRIRQCLSTVYAHKLLVGSPYMNFHRWKELKYLTNERMNKHREYYNRSAPVVKFFDFLRAAVDIWSETE